MKSIFILNLMILIFISLVFVSGCTTQPEQITEDNTVMSVSTPNVSNIECIPEWICSKWSECNYLKKQTRTCIDKKNCDVDTGKQTESQSCNLPVIEHLNINPCIGMQINLWSKPASATNGAVKIGSIPDCQNIQVEILYRKCSSDNVEFDLIRYNNKEGWVTRRTILCPAKYNETGCWYAPDTICPNEKKGDCPTGTVKINDEYGVCGECKNDDDCKLPITCYISGVDEIKICERNLCLNNKCYNSGTVECLINSDCPTDRPICEEWIRGYFKCIECKKSSDCTDSKKPYCDIIKNVCQESCYGNYDCTDPEKPYCTSLKGCVECYTPEYSIYSVGCDYPDECLANKCV